MDALLDAARRALGHAQQLDAIAQLVRRLEIGQGDRLDALHMDGLQIHRRAEGERGQDRELVGGIEAADVEGGVRLRIAEALGLLEAGLEGEALQLHAGEDVIAGAVENAIDAHDLVARQTLAQGLHDGDAPRHRGLEGQSHMLVFRQLGQSHAMGRQQRLVGGDDRLASGERRLHRLAGRALGAAHQLDEEVDVRRTGQGHGIVEPGEARDINAPLAVALAGADGGDRDGAPGPGRKGGGLAVEEADDGSADVAETGYANAQGLGHGASGRG